MKTSVYIGTSLDGFIARNNGDIAWLTQFANDKAILAYKEFMRAIDAIVIGRGTLEKILTFPAWPYDKKVFVLSTTIKEVPEPIAGNVSVVAMSPDKLLNHLSGRGFSNLYIDGGKVIQAFLKQDLIDELIIAKVPVLIGKGIPLFADLDIDINFEHNRTEVSSNGLVRSYYERLN